MASFSQQDYHILRERLNSRIDDITTEIQDTLKKYETESHIWQGLKAGWEFMLEWLQSQQRWPEVDTFADLHNDNIPTRKVLYVNGNDYANLSPDQLKKYPFIVIKNSYPQWLLGPHLQALKEKLEVQPDGILNIQKYAAAKPGQTFDERAVTVAAERIAEMIHSRSKETSKPLIRESSTPWDHRLPWNFLNIDGSILDQMSSPTAMHDCLRILDTLCEADKRRLSPKFGFGKPYDQPESKTFFADVESCRRFIILGEKGTFSGNHTDILGGTWILGLCGIKLWWAYTGAVNEEVKNTFVNWKASWNPGAGAMQLLPIEPGDYLLMMPGHLCAHAPFSMDDCLMTGGMFWNENTLPRLLDQMTWICEHNASVSNEGIPRQLITILDVLGKKSGLSDEVIAAIGRLEQRLRPKLSCQCSEAETGECGPDCSCANPLGLVDGLPGAEIWYRYEVLGMSSMRPQFDSDLLFKVPLASRHFGGYCEDWQVFWNKKTANVIGYLRDNLLNNWLIHNSRSPGCTSWCGCSCNENGLNHGRPKKRGRPKAKVKMKSKRPSVEASPKSDIMKRKALSPTVEIEKPKMEPTKRNKTASPIPERLLI
jgi:hypothetical protein